jgi:acyl carrier protein
MTLHSADAILRELADVTRRTFPDRDFPAPVGPETRVFADLNLASIDLVVLGEKLEQYYGRRLPFGLFLAGLRSRGGDDLELGELAAFLQQHVGGP